MPKYFITTKMCIDWLDQKSMGCYFYHCLVTDKSPNIKVFEIEMYNDLMEKYNVEKEKRYTDIDSITYIEKTIIQAHLLNKYRIWMQKVINKIASI